MRKRCLVLLIAMMLVFQTCYIDNFYVSYASTLDCQIEVICEELGQAFFTKQLDFDVRVKNNSDADATYKISAKLLNSKNTVDFENTLTADVKMGESADFHFSGEASSYGINTLIVQAENTATGEKTSYTTEIVTLRYAETQNPQIGICDHTALFGDGFERANEKMEFLRNAGIYGIRDLPQWIDWEKKIGEFKMPDKYKTVFDAAKANNIDFFSLTGMHNYLVAPGERPPKSEKAVKGFGEYAYHLAKDTMPYGNKYEIYNEWNVESFNTSWLPPEDYIPLIKEASARIKSANSNAKVYGLTGLTDITGTYKDWAKRMFEAGVAEYSDGFTIHPYDTGWGPDKTGRTIEAVKYVHDLMKEYGAADKELVISEMGWRTTDHTAEEIASYVVKFAAMTYDLADRIYWYNSQRKVNQTEIERGYGWMEDANEFANYVPYAPNEQFIAISNYNYHIANAVSCGQVEIPNSNALVYRFEKPDGEDVLIAWVKEGTNEEEITFNLDTAKVTVEDIYGNGSENLTEYGKLYITLTEEPQYIIGEFGDKSDSHKARVTVMNDEKNVCVSGNIGLADADISVYIEKDNELCYIDQIISDSNGNYSVSFPLDKSFGIYNLTLGTKEDGKTEMYFSFNIEAYETKLKKKWLLGWYEINDLNSVKKGDELTIELIKNTQSTVQPTLIVAQYGDGRLEAVQSFSETTQTPYKFTVASDTVDEIRTYVWNIINLQPLAKGENYK